jgi:septation ring formation regulator EzrA
MHVLMLTLIVAFVVCIVLLVVFGVFTTSRFADRVDHLHASGRR